MKKLFAILPLALCLSTLSFAHGDMEHVMGTVVQVTDHSLSVKTADGSVKIVAFDSATQFFKGSAAATAQDVQIGNRVVIHAHKHGEKLHAAEVKIGVSTATNQRP